VLEERVGAKAEVEVIAGANCQSKGDGTKEEKGRGEKFGVKEGRNMKKKTFFSHFATIQCILMIFSWILKMRPSWHVTIKIGPKNTLEPPH